MDNEFRIIELTMSIRNYGYVVLANPIDGLEEVFINGLKEDLAKIEKQAAAVRKTYGFRGMSKNVLKKLHEWMPEVSFRTEKV